METDRAAEIRLGLECLARDLKATSESLEQYAVKVPGTDFMDIYLRMDLHMMAGRLSRLERELLELRYRIEG